MCLLAIFNKAFKKPFYNKYITLLMISFAYMRVDCFYKTGGIKFDLDQLILSMTEKYFFIKSGKCPRLSLKVK